MGPHVICYPSWNLRSGGEKPLAANGTLGMALFLLAEIMFFSGLLSAYWVLRSGFDVWPPPSQPRLPWETTAVSTFLLLLSGGCLFAARRFAVGGQWRSMKRAMAACLALGSSFLLIQGYEWARLLGFGLRAGSGVYGGTFYLLIGCHALHVAAGLVYLFLVARRLGTKDAMGPRDRLTPALMYWTFVVALWPLLYGLVYF
ncbi:MAG TPA: cytochrome c oxidase subunit 3 [bacterium]|nr:cytochrome c oxidase subunit 3 [bacterium]